VTVADKPSVDVPVGTLGSIWNQAGLKSQANTMEYLVILEQSDTSFGAYVPDLPGCAAVGETKDETMQLIREAIELHLESLLEHGEDVPAPHSFVEKVAV
jgi:predicted RNase H-like HicB family nuclease